MSPAQGFVRTRKHQFGRQDGIGLVSAASRAYPASGVPDVELNWTDPEVDAGSIDPVAAPTRAAPELTFDEELSTLYYNDLTKVLCGFFGGMVLPTGGGTAKTWTHSPASETIDEPDYFSYQFGNTDVPTDWYQFKDGIVESFELTAPEGLGALSASATWRFGGVASTGSTDSPVTGTVPTPGLSVSTDDVPMYLKDAGIFIASSVAGLGAGQVMNALHSFVLRGSHEIDEKRWANKDQSFDADELVPGARSIELELTFSKTADTVGVGSESDAWMSDTSVNRYIKFEFESLAEAQSGIPYSWDVTLPARYYTRTEGEAGQNVVIVLTAHAFFDPVDLNGVFESVLINTLTASELGEGGS